MRCLSKFLKFGTLLCLLLASAACSSITKGTSQDILVDTQDVRDAKCTLGNEKGSWTIERTPGTATVSRGGGVLNVKCEKEAYHPSEQLVAEGFESMTLGNILIGGIIGVAVDAASGSAFNYPENVSIIMHPLNGEIPAPEEKKDQIAALPDAVTKPSEPAVSTAPKIEVTDVSRFQGNWQGYHGGCFNLGSWQVDIDVNLLVKDDFVYFELKHKNIFARPVHGFSGKDRFPKSRELIFDPEYSEVKNLYVTADEATGQMQISFDKKCSISLKRTNSSNLTTAFDGKPALNGNKPEPNQNLLLTSTPKVDMSLLQGNWQGYEGSGCFSVNSYLVDVTAKAKITGNNIKFGLTHQFNFGKTAYYAFKGDDSFTSSRSLLFNSGYNGNERLEVLLPEQNQDQILIKIGPRCVVKLEKTPQTTIEDDFKGEPAQNGRRSYQSATNNPGRRAILSYRL